MHLVIIGGSHAGPAPLRAGAVAAGMQYLTRMAGGTGIVFGLAVLFSALVSLGPYRETRTARPRTAPAAAAPAA